MAQVNFTDNLEVLVNGNSDDFRVDNLNPITPYRITINDSNEAIVTTSVGEVDISYQNVYFDKITWRIKNHIGLRFRVFKDFPFSNEIVYDNTLTLNDELVILEPLSKDTDYVAVIEDSLNSSVSCNTGLEPDPSWSYPKRIQHYLDHMGFDVGGVDGLFGAKSVSSLLIFQYFSASTSATGLLNNETLNQVGVAARSGVKASDFEVSKDSWIPQPHTVNQSDPTENGFLNPQFMTRLSTIAYEDCYIESNAAIGWAMLIDSAVKYNTTVPVVDQLNVSAFLPQGKNSGYRDYHNMVEAYITEFHGGNDAANIYFTSGVVYPDQPNKSVYGDAKNTAANDWIQDNWDSYSNNGIWDDVPANDTDAGGDLEGYGTSKHGWGLAIDMNVKDPGDKYYRVLADTQTYNGTQYNPGDTVTGIVGRYHFWGGTQYNFGKGKPLTKEVEWMRLRSLNGTHGEFGFTGFFSSTNTVPNNGENGTTVDFSETWHWNYTQT